MTNLPLGIPPLPHPPHTYLQTVTPPGNSSAHWCALAPQPQWATQGGWVSPATPMYSPCAPAHPGPSHAGPSNYASALPHSSNGKKHWKDYMRSLGGRMGKLELDADSDKPLPPIPTASNDHDLRPVSAPPAGAVVTQPSSNPHTQPWLPPAHFQRPMHHPAAFAPPPPIPPRPQRLLDPSNAQVQNQTLQRPISAPSRPFPASSLGGNLSGGKVPPRKSATGPATGNARKSCGTLNPGSRGADPGRITAHGSSTPSRSAPTKKKTPVIDLTEDSDDSYVTSDEDSPPPRCVGHRRAVSAQPALQRIIPLVHVSPRTPPSKTTASRLSASQSKVASSPSSPGSPAVRCAGFTRSGQPCKRLVKSAAPFLLQRDTNIDDDDAERMVGRYCKDHAGLVCAADGFYWRDANGKAGVWVEFSDYIPSDLGQQTQTLLRMTMESPLTAKELPGFLYAYELRDIATTSTSYFKVGRTDNVPRRIGQWSNQCTSHTPTLRDIFPLKAPPVSGLLRKPSAPGSLLPGAVKGGVDGRRMVPAVKRWERLVHLELADRAATLRAKQFDDLSKPCTDCGAIHKEIFPLADGGTLAAYESVVVDAIGRWEAFIRLICA